MGEALGRGRFEVKRTRTALLAAALAALLGSGCGLVNHDVTVNQDFQTGGAPSVTGQVNASALTQPLSASAGDLTKLSSVTLQSVTLASNDTGDLSYVGPVTLIISASGFPDATLATFAGRPAAGTNSVNFTVDSSKDLRAYLAAGAVLKAVVTYAVQPVTARGLRLTLVVRGSL